MSISIQRVTYIHADKEILFKDLNLSVNKGQKIALVGDNGSGKSTLLELITGWLSPSSGIIIRPDKLYYVPQHFGQYDNQSISQALQTDNKIKALHAILNGDTDIENFNILDDDWSIEERIHAALAFWGIADKQLSQPMSDLSGGEKTRVFLAAMEIHTPSVILMDEPTNHLDTLGREKLYNFIKKTTATLVIVSHDRTLLNLLNTTCELTRNCINTYGGNYEFYKEQKRIRQNALRQELEEKEKQLRLAKRIAREAAERKEKQNIHSEKTSAQKGISRMAINTLRDKAEKSTTRLSGIHAEKTEKIAHEMKQIKSSLPNLSLLRTDFNASGLHSGKTLATATNINFAYTLGQKIWQAPICFQLKSGDRICIEGANGSGKTTLIKLICGELAPTEGDLLRADFKYVYLNQEYSIIQNERSVFEQAEAFNTRNLPEHEIKIILNRYLFPSTVWDKSCEKLSGGEKMRLAFCCLMIGNNTPDLFVLDEPTNNLDIQSIEIITSTIRNYTGTVLVVSHDKYFINEINIEKSIHLLCKNILSQKSPR